MITSAADVYISNMTEDIWDYFRFLVDPQMLHFELKGNASLADRDLFCFAPHERMTFVLPGQVRPEFLKYFETLFGKKDYSFIVPPEHSGSVCDDVLADSGCLEELLQACKTRPDCNIAAYSSSAQFFRLIDWLRNKDARVSTPESPLDRARWTRGFFGSKTGIRQLIQKLQAQQNSFCMADGWIAANHLQAAEIAATVYDAKGAVVLKINCGHAGSGVKIFRPGSLPSGIGACREFLLDFFHREGFWEKLPIVIEDYIDLDPSIAGGTPNMELKIDPRGEIEWSYPCAMMVSSEGEFEGVEISKDCMPREMQREIYAICETVGREYSKAGYRGHWELDFMYGKDGRLYITESNLRRTGGTHTYLCAKHLLGDDFLDRYCIRAMNCYPLAAGRALDFSRLLRLLEPLLWDAQQKKGLLIASEMQLSMNFLAYIAIGHNRRETCAIEAEMKRLLQDL